MKIVASIILAFGWLGLVYTQFGLIGLEEQLSDMVYRGVAYVITPIILLVSGGIYLCFSVLHLPRFNGITWLMSGLGLFPFVYFYAQAILDIFNGV